MQTVYFISGMGADERAFQYLDLSFCNPVFVQWIKPLENEPITGYAARLAQQITKKEPIIVGLSFGGVVAIELSKLIPLKKLVLLSSAKTGREIPFYYRALRYLPLHKLISASALRSGNQLAYRLMGIAERADKKVFTRMLQVSDAGLLKWSIHQLAHWENTQYPSHTHHIHGTRDLMLPIRFVQATETVQGGAHLMLMSKPEEVSALLKRVILSEP